MRDWHAKRGGVTLLVFGSINVSNLDNQLADGGSWMSGRVGRVCGPVVRAPRVCPQTTSPTTTLAHKRALNP